MGAYALWGVGPLYWRLLRGVSPMEILAHRTVWGLVAYALLSFALGVGPAILAAARSRRTLLALGAAGALLAVNWGVFIYAIATDRLLQASLGYFINPLLSVVLGALVLRERLRPLQKLATGLAALGVLQVALQAGGNLWIALTLAGTFGIYSMVRKLAAVEALAGSTLETAFMAPFGLLWLLWLAQDGSGSFGVAGPRLSLLLAGAGVLTALPLVWFTAAARRLPLSSLGFLQFLSPSIQFLMAVFLFHEPVRPADIGAFACIWAGLAVFVVDLRRAGRA